MAKALHLLRWGGFWFYAIAAVLDVLFGMTAAALHLWLLVAILGGCLCINLPTAILLARRWR